MMFLTPALFGASILALFPAGAITFASPVTGVAHSTTLFRRNLDEHTSIGRVVSNKAECMPCFFNPGYAPEDSDWCYGIRTPAETNSVHTFVKGDTVRFACWINAGPLEEGGHSKRYYASDELLCWVDGDRIVTEVNAAHGDIKECVFIPPPS